MELDAILKKYIGEIGLYQVLTLLFVSSLGIHAAFNTIDYNFIGAIPDFFCDVGNMTDHITSNLTFEEMKMLTSPMSLQGEYDTCFMYVRNYSTMSVTQAKDIIDVGDNSTVMLPPVIACERWIFSKEEFKSTVATEWQLVCDKEWMIATSQAVAMSARYTVFIGGFVADKFGRRFLILTMLCLNLASRTMCALAINYYMFVAARFFMQIVEINWYTICFVMVVELMTPKYRATAGQLGYYFWSIGSMITAGLAYFIRDWRHLTAFIFVFLAPYMTYFCLLPESARWLLAKSRKDEALDLLKRMARFNGKEFPRDVNLSFKSKEKEEQASLKQLFESKQLVKITLILVFLWFTSNLTYYGLFFYLPKLGGNIYLSTTISGALEIPALLYIQLSVDTRLGRRINTSGTLFASGIALLALMLIPKDYNWLIITFALIGRFTITSALAVVYIYTTELFPTIYRGTGLTVCSTVATTGVILSPYIALLAKISFYIPSLSLGSLSIVAGFLTILLPETRGTRLPDTFKEVEATTNRHKPEVRLDEEMTQSEKDDLLLEKNSNV